MGLQFMLEQANLFGFYIAQTWTILRGRLWLIILMLVPAIFLHLATRGRKNCSPTTATMLNFVSFLTFLIPPIGYAYLRRPGWCLGIYGVYMMFWKLVSTFAPGILIDTTRFSIILLTIATALSLPALYMGHRINRLCCWRPLSSVLAQHWKLIISRTTLHAGWKYSLIVIPMTFLLLAAAVIADLLLSPMLLYFVAILGTVILFFVSHCAALVAIPRRTKPLKRWLGFSVLCKSYLTTVCLFLLFFVALSLPYAYRWSLLSIESSPVGTAERTPERIPPNYLEWTNEDAAAGGGMLPVGSRLNLIGPVSLPGQENRIWHYKAETSKQR